MKQLTNLTAQSIDVVDIAPPNMLHCNFGGGGIAITAQNILVYSILKTVAIPIDEIIRLAKEADPDVDLTPDGMSAYREKLKSQKKP